MRTSKYSTAITNCEKNQGLHSVKAIRKAQDIVLHCADTYAEAHMYHTVIVGSQSVADYRWAYNSLVDKLRDFGFQVEFFGALEMAEDKGGLHCHIFLIIECAHANPAGVKRTSKTGNTKVVKIMSTEKDSWLKKTLAKRGMTFHFSEPKNEIHRTRTGKMPMHARPTLKGGRLADCLQWSSYPYKVRSKENVPSREIYFFSTFDANKAKQRNSTKEETNEEQFETTPDASSEAYSPAGPHASQRISSTDDGYSGDKALVHAGQSAHGNEEARSEIKASTEAQRYSDGRASPYYERTEVMLTASQKFLASLYEQAVDQGLDVDAMRKYLLERGVKRTPLQLEDELENVYGFYGYPASHPPKPVMSVAEYDRTVYRLR